MSITSVSDREAAKLLGVTYATIRNAVGRGALSRIPKAGQVQHVAKEQVELFAGKKQIVLGALSSEELRMWMETRGEIVSSSAQDTDETIGIRELGKILVAYNEALHNLTEEEKKSIVNELEYLWKTTPNIATLCMAMLAAAYGTAWLVKIAKNLWNENKNEVSAQSADDKIINIADKIRERSKTAKEAVPLAIEEAKRLAAL